MHACRPAVCLADRNAFDSQPRHVFASVAAAMIKVTKSAYAARICGHESLNCSTVEDAVALASLDGTHLDIMSTSAVASAGSSRWGS